MSAITTAANSVSVPEKFPGCLGVADGERGAFLIVGSDGAQVLLHLAHDGDDAVEIGKIVSRLQPSRGVDGADWHGEERGPDEKVYDVAEAAAQAGDRFEQNRDRPGEGDGRKREENERREQRPKMNVGIFGFEELHDDGGDAHDRDH